MDAKRYDESDFPDDEIEIRRSADGAAVALPNSAGRLDAEQTVTLRELQRLGQQIAMLEEQADALAESARADGISWALVGWCLGITGEAARRRYGLDPAHTSDCLDRSYRDPNGMHLCRPGPRA